MCLTWVRRSDPERSSGFPLPNHLTSSLSLTCKYVSHVSRSSQKSFLTCNRFLWWSSLPHILYPLPWSIHSPHGRDHMSSPAWSSHGVACWPGALPTQMRSQIESSGTHDSLGYYPTAQLGFKHDNKSLIPVLQHTITICQHGVICQPLAQEPRPTRCLAEVRP